MAEQEFPSFGLQGQLGWGDQRRHLPGYEDRVGVAAQFHAELYELLTANDVNIIYSSYRAKTNKDIQAKLRRRMLMHRWRPISDIYGARFILSQEQVPTAADVIISSYPAESRYPYDLPYIRDLTDPNTPRTVYSNPRYQAVHVYVAFGGGEVPNIGEVQLMTPTQLIAANKTRRQYERRQARHLRRPAQS